MKEKKTKAIGGAENTRFETNEILGERKLDWRFGCENTWFFLFTYFQENQTMAPKHSIQANFVL